MPLYTRIIVPLDGSKLAESALPEARKMAVLTGAELLLLRVIDYSSKDRFGDFGLLYEYEAIAKALEEEQEVAEAYRKSITRLLTEIESSGGAGIAFSEAFAEAQRALRVVEGLYARTVAVRPFRVDRKKEG